MNELYLAQRARHQLDAVVGSVQSALDAEAAARVTLRQQIAELQRCLEHFDNQLAADFT